LQIQLQFNQLCDFPMQSLDGVNSLLFGGKSLLVGTKEAGER
jgi:hypothetical protein